MASSAARYRRGTIGVGSSRALLVEAPGGITPVNSPAMNTRFPTSTRATTFPARSEPSSPGSSDGLVPQVGFGSDEKEPGRIAGCDGRRQGPGGEPCQRGDDRRAHQPPCRPAGRQLAGGGSAGVGVSGGGSGGRGGRRRRRGGGRAGSAAAAVVVVVRLGRRRRRRWSWARLGAAGAVGSWSGPGGRGPRPGRGPGRTPCGPGCSCCRRSRARRPCRCSGRASCGTGPRGPGTGPGSPATWGLWPSGAGWPLPAMVVMIPDGSIRRMRAPPSSATKRLPAASAAMPRGPFRRAAVAGPPSPLDSGGDRVLAGLGGPPGGLGVAGDGGDLAVGRHLADEVVLAVGEVDGVVRRRPHALRGVELGVGGELAVTAVALVVQVAGHPLDGQRRRP